MRKLFMLTSILAFATSASAQESVKGTVKWTDDKVPKLEAINVTNDKAVCCKNGDLMPNKPIVDAKTLGVKYVVVWIRPDSDERTAAIPKNLIPAAPKSVEHVIDQPNCQFEPRVIAMREGDKLKIKNSATIPHNINCSTDSTETSFNVTVPAGGEYAHKNPFMAQRLPAAFKCDIHPWMGGRIRIFDHPFYAVTKDDGTFEIKDVPVGKWRIVYWHEDGLHKGKDGVLGFPIEVTKGKALQLNPIKLELPK